MAGGGSLCIKTEHPIEVMAAFVAVLQEEFGAVVEEIDGHTSQVMIWISVPVGTA